MATSASATWIVVLGGLLAVSCLRFPRGRSLERSIRPSIDRRSVATPAAARVGRPGGEPRLEAVGFDGIRRQTGGDGGPWSVALERIVGAVSFSGRDRGRDRGDDGGGDEGPPGGGDRPPRSASDLTRAEARRILGVGLTADDDEIRSAYRERVKAVHPDNGGDRTALMRVAAAYERLTD